jgi:glycosyltransferase involved in cell wall biosynthesis
VCYGRKVEVVAGLPGYSAASRIRAPMREKYCGIRIRRIPYLRAPKDKSWGRLLRDGSFFLSLFLTLLLRALFRRRRETWLFVSAPTIAPFVGALLKKAARVRLVYLLYDLYPDLAITVGFMKKHGLAAKLLRFITHRSLHTADTVICLGHDAKKKLIEEYSVNPQKIQIIQNWADEEKFERLSEELRPVEETMLRSFNLFYTGNIGLYYALEDVVEAARKLQEHEGVQFVFVGEGGKKPRLEELVREKNIGNVVFLPYQSLEMYPAVLAQADALIVTSQAGMEGISVPCKAYSYMASGKPILAMLPRNSEIGIVLEREKCGLRVDPGDIDGFCSSVLRLYHDRHLRGELGTAAKMTFEKNYRRSLMTRKYLDVL